LSSENCNIDKVIFFSFSFCVKRLARELRRIGALSFLTPGWEITFYLNKKNLHYVAFLNQKEFFPNSQFWKGKVYRSDSPILNVWGWVPCVQTTSHLKYMGLVTCVQVTLCMSGQFEYLFENCVCWLLL